MFAKRRIYSITPYLDKDSLLRLRHELEKCGFSSFEVRRPYNLIQNKDEDLMSLEEFINKERNYPAIIFQAKRNQNDIIKFLFVNKPNEANFFDDIKAKENCFNPRVKLLGSSGKKLLQMPTLSTCLWIYNGWVKI